MIELRNITKRYGNLTVVDNVSLDITPHQIISVVGPSGAGKTTLLHIAGTLDYPDSGEIIYDGVNITTLSDKRLSEFRNRKIGFIFQFHRLLPEFSALENVAMPAMIGGLSRSAAFRKSTELLELLNLSDRMKHRPAQMSGGERQRTAIARALVNNPDVIFADEPTGSLDTANRDEIYSIISSLCNELHHTFVIVSHDPTITGIAHRIINMADGKITEIVEQNDIPKVEY